MFYSALLAFLVLTGQAYATQDCSPKRVKYSAVDNSFKFETLNYSSTQNLNKVILLLPPTGGTSQLDRGSARFFCEQGMTTIIVDKWTDSNITYPIEDFEVHERELAAAKRAVLSMTNQILKDKNIGIFALSKGAIGATVYKKDFLSNVKSMFLSVAGGPVELTISRAGEENLRQAREDRIRHFRITQEEYDRLISDALVFRTPRSKGTLKLAMVVSNNDSTVPSYLQRHLLEQWQPDIHWVTNVGHFRSVVYTHIVLKSRVLNFFRETLN